MEEIMQQRFGPLLSLSQLASILDRSPDGLRVSLRTENEWAVRINRVRVKIGGRIYFKTSGIAALLCDVKVVHQLEDFE